MVGMSALIRSCALALALALLAGADFGAAMWLSSARAQTAAAREAPSQHEVDGMVVNYRRLRPNVATGGLIQPGAVPRLKELGFATIVDLRGPAEGTAVEQQATEAAGLRYINIPVTEVAPTTAQIAEFARVVEDAGNSPMLVHCASANRVGAMWALYKAHIGTIPEMAVAEARAIGLHGDREAEVRKRLSGVATDKGCEPGRC